MCKPNCIIDAHQHLWCRQVPQKFADQTLDLMLEKNEENGVRETWLSAVFLEGHPAENPIDHFIEEAFHKYPKQIRGMGFIHLGTYGAEKVYEFKDRGFFGLKIIFPASSYDDPAYNEIWEAAIDSKMPVTFHTGRNVGTYSKLPWMNPLDMKPERLSRVAYSYPELIILLAHMGNTCFQEACCLAMKPNVYLDCSGGGILKAMPKSYFENTVYWEQVKHKLVYGVDNLFIDAKKEIDRTAKFAETVGLSAENIELMWQGNAEEIIQAVKG